MSDLMLKATVSTTLTYKHPYAGHVNVARALKAAGFDYETPANKPDEVRVIVHRNVPVEDVEPKAAQAIASALCAMGVVVHTDTSTNR